MLVSKDPFSLKLTWAGLTWVMFRSIKPIWLGLTLRIAFSKLASLLGTAFIETDLRNADIEGVFVDDETIIERTNCQEALNYAISGIDDFIEWRFVILRE